MYRTLLFAGEIVRGGSEDDWVHDERGEELYTERETEFENSYDDKISRQ